MIRFSEFRDVVRNAIQRILLSQDKPSVIREVFKVAYLRGVAEHLYLVKDLGNGLAQVRVPDGWVIQPMDGDAYSVKRDIYWVEVYDRFSEIRNDSVIIDVGAHVGVFTLKAARRAKNGLVIAVEPHPLNFRLLLANARLNHLGNVVPVNVALANYDGMIELYEYSSSGAHSIVRHKDYAAVQALKLLRSVQVKVRKLDSIVNDLRLEKVDFIKIDVEGAELEVLKGSQRTLENNRDGGLTVVVAAYHYSEEAEEVSKFLMSLGFRALVYYDRRAPYILGKHPTQHFPGTGVSREQEEVV